MKALLERVEAIDALQGELETLGVELISHPDLETKSHQVRIALAYATLQKTLQTPAAPEPTPEQPAQFNEQEERLGEQAPKPSHEETAS